MCMFCDEFDFETASAIVDGRGASICIAGGSGRYTKEEQFKFCPVCGKRLDPYYYDGMSNEQAERIMDSHLMQLVLTMPTEWIETHGAGSEFIKAYGMALDALKVGCNTEQVSDGG